MNTVCPTCNVALQVPDEARAFRCHNCGELATVDASGAARRAKTEATSSQVAKVVVIVLGIILLWFLLQYLL